jgi:hypothetical protein
MDQASGTLCVLTVLTALAASIGAVFLRASIFVHNKMFAGPDSPKCIPEPVFTGAIKISLLPALVFVVGGPLIGTLMHIAGASRDNAGLAGLFLVLPFIFLCMAVVLRKKLSMTVGRAALVALLWLFIGVAVVGGTVMVTYWLMKS